MLFAHVFRHSATLYFSAVAAAVAFALTCGPFFVLQDALAKAKAKASAKTKDSETQSLRAIVVCLQLYNVLAYFMGTVILWQEPAAPDGSVAPKRRRRT